MCLGLLLCVGSNAQKQIDYSSQIGYIVPEYPDDMTLIHHVVFVHDSMTMYCDSAIYNKKENYFFAFGNILMVEKDMRLTGDELHYYGNERVGHLSGKVVVLKDKDATLVTDFLLLDRNENTVKYYTGAEMWDEKDTLTSKEGTYFIDDKLFNFFYSVHLTSPNADIDTDSLLYDSKVKQADFLGPSTIDLKDSTKVFCTQGYYKTKTQEMYSEQRAQIYSKDGFFTGDTIYYHKKDKNGYAYGNLFVQDTANDLELTCDSLVLNTVDTVSVAFFSSEIFVKQTQKEDTLYFHCDTLEVRMDTSFKAKDIYGYKHCKFFRQDMQGVSEWCHYNTEDSLLTMLIRPMIWTEDDSQLNSDTIVLSTGSDGVKQIFMYPNPLIVQNSDSLSSQYFNQVSGRHLTGWFEDNSICYAEIEGNSEVVYYLWDEKKQKADSNLVVEKRQEEILSSVDEKTEEQVSKPRKKRELTGVNIGKSQNLRLYFHKGEIKKMTAVNNPLYYMDQDEKIAPEVKRLKGFVWNIEDKPKKIEDIFVHRQ